MITKMLTTSEDDTLQDLPVQPRYSMTGQHGMSVQESLLLMLIGEVIVIIAVLAWLVFVVKIT